MPDETTTKEGADLGVLLPDTDPSVGEIVAATLQGNPTANLGQIIVALVTQAPAAELAVELVHACLELLICHDKGKLFLLELQAGSILIGARKVRARDAMVFGANTWPMAALLAGTPTSVTIDTGRGRHRVWMASEPMDGVSVRASEATALGNSFVENFNGRIVEDRISHDVMRRSAIDAQLTQRAMMRAQALSEVDRLSVDMVMGINTTHARVSMAEAVPGSCSVGMKLAPEGFPERVYTVARRINESWVLLVADLPGEGSIVEACAWLSSGDGPALGLPPDWGFSDAPALLPTPAPVLTQVAPEGEA